jgi:hypothetical protein
MPEQRIPAAGFPFWVVPGKDYRSVPPRALEWRSHLLLVAIHG